MKHQVISRTQFGIGALAMVFAVAIVATTAWSEPGSAPEPGSGPDSAKKESKATAPELVVVRFYADWCGYCKALDAEIDKVREKLADKPVLFLQLDLTDETTRPQAELLASLLGIDEAWAEHNQKTGFALLIKPGGEVVGQLAVGKEAEEIHAALTEKIGG